MEEPEYVPEIFADRLSLMRILRNLVENALKYGGEGLSGIHIKLQR
jgi:signal transduction histidine kinase